MTRFSSPPGCTEQQRMYLGESCKHFLGFEQPTVVQNLRYPPLKSLPSGYPGDSTIHRLNNRSKVHIARDLFCNLKLAWIQSLTPSVSDSKPCLKFRLISTKKIRNYAIRHFHIDHSTPCLPPKILHKNYFQCLLGITTLGTRRFSRVRVFLPMWGGALRDDTKNGCVAD